MDALLVNQRITFHRPLQALLSLFAFLLLVAILAVGIHGIMADDPVGMDLHTFYLAAQNVFLKHENPYGEDIAIQSQLSVLGRLANEQEDQMGFSYPPYSLLLLAPIAHLSYGWVQAIWMSFFLLGSIGTVLVAFPKRPLLPALGVVLFYPFTFGIILGNFVNLIALIILLAIPKILAANKPTTGYQILLGFLLAWTTIKPQFVWLFLILLFLTSIKKQLWPLLVSFGTSLAGFLGVSFIMVPNWPELWLERIGKYVDYTGHYPNLTLYLNQLRTPSEAQTLTVALIALLLGMTAWALYAWWKGRLSFLLLIAWAGIVIYLINPRTVSYTQIAFLIPLLIWAQSQKNQRSLPIIIFFWGALILSWIIFFLGQLGTLGQLVEEWRLVIGCLWVLWLLIWPPANLEQSQVKSVPM